MKQPAFYIDMTACTGCKTCMVACIDGHDLPQGVMWRRVAEYTGGKWVRRANGTYDQNVFSYYTSVSCNHCQNPLCVEACPMRAIHFGEYEDLKKQFGDAVHVAPLPEQSVTSPCLVITPPHNAQPVGSNMGSIRNPEEM